MKVENPREDSWSWARRGSLRTLRKSQVLADSGRVVENRGCRTASLPRPRSPVRTRCSAPVNASAFLANFERPRLFFSVSGPQLDLARPVRCLAEGLGTTRKSASGLAGGFAAMLTGAL